MLTINTKYYQPSNWRISLPAVLIGLSLAFVFSTVQAKDMVGWQVEGEGTGIQEGQTYSLRNLDQDRYLKLQDRDGANLGWDTEPNQKMKVKRMNAGSGPIKCGEPFGLFIDKEWVMYDNQTTGINLSTRTKFGTDPVYQWKFSNCNEGDIVPLSHAVGLKKSSGIVGCRRMWGVNLCWAEDVVTVNGKNYHKDAIPSKITDVAKRAAVETIK